MHSVLSRCAFLVGLSFFLVPHVIWAQYRFDSFTTDNGLPQVSVNRILQTRDGFLWLTTFGGLVRYDGLRFDVYNAGNTKGLKTSRFLNLFEDREGNLWITTEGQGITRYRDGSFTTYTTENGLSDNLITQMEESSDGTFLTTSGGRIFEWKDGSFGLYTPANGEPVKNILFRTASGAIWYLENAKLRKFENGRVTVDYAPDFEVLRVFEDSKGRVWLARKGEYSLSMLKDNRLKSFSAKDGYTANRFVSVSEDREGAVWFSTGGGLLHFQNDKFTHYRTTDGLISDGVNYVFQDREGTIWVATSGGLSRLTTQTLTTFSMVDGLVADNVYPIYQDRQGKIWIGSWGGLTVYESGIFRNVGAQYEVDGKHMTALFEDRDGAFWIGNFGGEIRRIEGERITTFEPTQKKINTHVISQDRAGTMWFGTENGLLKGIRNNSGVLNDKEDFLFISYLPGKEIFVIREDRQGQLWIGTNSGLMKYDGNVFTPLTEADGIAPNLVRSIIEDEDGTLWIGMYDSGLYRYKDGNFTHFTMKDGLFDNGAFQIIEDSSGNFWISCNLGIYRVKKSDLNDFAEGRAQKITSVPYNRRDGMLNSECNGGNQPAGIKTNDGKLWFPTQKGVVVIDPESVPLNLQPPPVVIESFIIDTQPASIYSPVTIQPEQTYLEIHYSGLSFINPELVKFKYRLEGFDTGWIDAGTRRTAYYTHLPPGKYRFTVSAANRDGVWNEQGASIEITVLPPFWKTWAFTVLVVFAAVGLAYAYYRRRTAKLEKERAGQQQFSQQLIESQENERQRIAAELHDGLGQNLMLIKNWALLGLSGLEENDNAKKELDAISASASHAIDEARGIAYNLRPFQLDAVGLTSSLEEMIERVGDSSNIQFSMNMVRLDNLFSDEAEINIYRVVQECLSNIVKHSQADQANVSIEKNAQRVVLKISDNGKGFFPSENGSASKKNGFGLKGSPSA